ncbi:MAG TPA: glycosyltransferase [Flavisolibacter sp.]|jgi:hypothetical protein|nr:glycosyltransferase [Flavisolibacter sp.]
MTDQLAIVIPAYKLTFFDKALNSIACQTNKNFTLYIGDDNSFEDLFLVVKRYQSQINIVYKKFDENLGSRSVVHHWERCIALTGDEEWIWLFSDDDIMAEDCVEQFYKAITETKSGFDVYRFNCCIINEAGKPMTGISQYPSIQTSYQFLWSRLTYQCHSYIVNAVFSRKVYIQNQGFVNFTVAWCSDDATWIRFAQEKGIYTLKNGLVYWRQSTLNISGNRSCRQNRQKKYRGAGQFVSWIYYWASENKVQMDDIQVLTWYYTMLKLIGYPKRIRPYFMSKPFRRHFWRKNFILQYRLLKKRA